MFNTTSFRAFVAVSITLLSQEAHGQSTFSPTPLWTFRNFPSGFSGTTGIYGDEEKAPGLSFRGIPVGITLAQFKEIAFPDLTKWRDVKPICTGDAEEHQIFVQKPRAPERYQQAGVSACMYYRYDESLNKWIAWAPDFAGVGNYNTTFYFAPKNLGKEGASRLFLISIEPPTRYFKKITEALKRDLGPADAKTGMARNGLGVTINFVELKWVIGESVVQVSGMGSNADVMTISYQQAKVFYMVDRAVKALAIGAADKL